MLDGVNAMEKNNAGKGNRENVSFCHSNKMLRGGITAEEIFE